MASITYYVMVPFTQVKGAVSAGNGVQCPSERSAVAQARGAVAKGAVGAVAFKRSGDPSIGEYGDAILIAQEGLVPEEFAEFLAA